MNMMTLKEVRDLFEVEYRALSMIRGAPPVFFTDKEIAFWISEAQMVMLEELKYAKVYVDIIVTPGVNAFTLPLDYGIDIKCEVNGRPLDKVIIEDILTTDETLTTGATDISAYAIYFDPDEKEWKIVFAPMCSLEERVRLWFYPNKGLYRPTLGKNQEWGKFDGSDFAGYITVPFTYIPLMITYMLGRFFEDKKLEFQAKTLELREKMAVSRTRKFKYRFGEKQ